MPFSLDLIDASLINAIDNTVFTAQDVVEQAIVDINTVRRDSSGRVKTYVAYQIGDPQPYGATSFVGPRGDDYIVPVYLRIVTPDPASGRILRNFAIDRFLGLSFPWAGQIRKRVSGGVFPLTKSDGAVECYITPVSFGVLVQLATVV